MYLLWEIAIGILAGFLAGKIMRGERLWRAHRPPARPGRFGRRRVRLRFVRDIRLETDRHAHRRHRGRRDSGLARATAVMDIWSTWI